MAGTIEPVSLLAAPQPSPATDKLRWWVVAVVVAAQFMFVVDAFIVNVALPSIRADLHASAGEMDAVIAVYQIAYASLVITGARLGDIFGRRRIFVTGVLAFTAISLWCGLAGSGAELVLARLVQGATAALMVPQVLATLHTLFPGADRERAFAVFGVALGLGGTAGFALGGWLVTLDLAGLGWRTVFLVNLPVGLAIAGFALWLMPAMPRRPDTRLDIPGAVILFLSLMCLIGPILVGHELGWPWWVLSSMVAGGALLGLFLRLEQRIERRGGLALIDMALLRDPAFRRGLAAVFSFYSGNVSFYLIITLFMQNQLGLPPVRSGLAVVPLALAFTVASQLAGCWTTRHGMRVLFLGCAVQFGGIAALGSLAALAAHPSMVPLMAALAVFGFGQGLVMAPLVGVVLATVRPGHAGSASGLLNTVQQAAGAMGVSLVGMIYSLGDAAERRGVLAALVLLGLSVIATSGLLAWMRSGRAGHG